MDTAPTALETIFDGIGDGVTAAAGWVGDWIGVITAPGNELLLIFIVILPLLTIGITIVKRLIRVRG